MFWHIAKRELYDNMNSLRFAVTTILLLALMVVNAVGYFGEYNARLTEYRRKVSESLDKMEDNANRLFSLVRNGPGKLRKKPSALTFCADGGEAFLSEYAEGRKGGWSYRWNRDNPSYRVEGIWYLNYPQANPSLWNIMPADTNMSWVSTIGLVLSFVAILFTFDAISGERERGTLQLMLSNSVPRGAILLGKFVAAFLSIGLPFLIAALINLFLLYTAGGVPLGANEWTRLGIILLIAVFYIAIFVALGLLVSSRIIQSSISLMVLLLIWATWVVLTPSTLGSIATGLKPAQTSAEFEQHRGEQRDNLKKEYSYLRQLKFEGPTRSYPPTKGTQRWAEYVEREAELSERLNKEHLRDQINQIKFARSLTRISPASIVEYAIESLAGTGFSRHLQFLDQVNRFAPQFRAFISETDAADAESPHIFGVKEGMSDKPVRFEAIPKFQDRASLSSDFNAAAVDVLLLILFGVVLFASAYLSFLRADIL